eukprot:Rhum_TRINITY_DN25437_c0_g1::Rhum_TRINITY_DN25437_c0_g1_i1::g.182091::m.182091
MEEETPRPVPLTKDDVALLPDQYRKRSLQAMHAAHSTDVSADAAKAKKRRVDEMTSADATSDRSTTLQGCSASQVTDWSALLRAQAEALEGRKGPEEGDSRYPVLTQLGRGAKGRFVLDPTPGVCALDVDECLLRHVVYGEVFGGKEDAPGAADIPDLRRALLRPTQADWEAAFDGGLPGFDTHSAVLSAALTEEVAEEMKQRLSEDEDLARCASSEDRLVVQKMTQYLVERPGRVSEDMRRRVLDLATPGAGAAEQAAAPAAPAAAGSSGSGNKVDKFLKRRANAVGEPPAAAAAAAPEEASTGVAGAGEEAALKKLTDLANATRKVEGAAGTTASGEAGNGAVAKTASAAAARPTEPVKFCGVSYERALSRVPSAIGHAKPAPAPGCLRYMLFTPEAAPITGERELREYTAQYMGNWDFKGLHPVPEDSLPPNARAPGVWVMEASEAPPKVRDDATVLTCGVLPRPAHVLADDDICKILIANMGKIAWSPTSVLLGPVADVAQKEVEAYAAAHGEQALCFSELEEQYAAKKKEGPSQAAEHLLTMVKALRQMSDYVAFQLSQRVRPVGKHLGILERTMLVHATKASRLIAWFYTTTMEGASDEVVTQLHDSYYTTSLEIVFLYFRLQARQYATLFMWSVARTINSGFHRLKPNMYMTSMPIIDAFNLCMLSGALLHGYEVSSTADLPVRGTLFSFTKMICHSKIMRDGQLASVSWKELVLNLTTKVTHLAGSTGVLSLARAQACSESLKRTMAGTGNIDTSVSMRDARSSCSVLKVSFAAAARDGTCGQIVEALVAEKDKRTSLLKAAIQAKKNKLNAAFQTIMLALQNAEGRDTDIVALGVNAVFLSILISRPLRDVLRAYFAGSTRPGQSVWDGCPISRCLLRACRKYKWVLDELSTEACARELSLCAGELRHYVRCYVYSQNRGLTTNYVRLPMLPTCHPTPLSPGFTYFHN